LNLWPGEFIHAETMMIVKQANTYPISFFILLFSIAERYIMAAE
jgi:hypothetical protein